MKNQRGENIIKHEGTLGKDSLKHNEYFSNVFLLSLNSPFKPVCPKKPAEAMVIIWIFLSLYLPYDDNYLLFCFRRTISLIFPGCWHDLCGNSVLFEVFKNLHCFRPCDYSSRTNSYNIFYPFFNSKTDKKQILSFQRHLCLSWFKWWINYT